jgi:hypothetical protein
VATVVSFGSSKVLQSLNRGNFVKLMQRNPILILMMFLRSRVRPEFPLEMLEVNLDDSRFSKESSFYFHTLIDNFPFLYQVSISYFCLSSIKFEILIQSVMSLLVVSDHNVDFDISKAELM